MRKKLVEMIPVNTLVFLLRAALKQLLNGDIYHMETVGKERKDHHLLWWKALGGEITKYIIHITIALVVYMII